MAFNRLICIPENISGMQLQQFDDPAVSIANVSLHIMKTCCTAIKKQVPAALGILRSSSDSDIAVVNFCTVNIEAKCSFQI